MPLSSDINLFPPLESFGDQEAFFVFFVVVHFSPSWWCFPWYDILKNLVGFLYISWRLTPVDKGLSHKSFLENLMSVFWLLPSWLRGLMSHIPYLYREHLCHWMLRHFYLLEILAKDYITTLNFFLQSLLFWWGIS